MTTRRTFLCSAVASTFAAGPVLASPLFNDKDPSVLPITAIYDEHFAAARGFADEAQAQGVATLGFTHDPSRLWRTQLRPALTDRRVALVGLTSQGSLFYLERLAWDVGMRVVMRIDHLDASCGAFHHVTAVAPASACAGMAAAGCDFGGEAARLLLSTRAAWVDCTHASPSKAVDAAFDAEPLVTWAIAPVRSDASRA